MSTNNTYRSGWSYVGEGIAWLLILLSIGGCVWLCKQDPNQPIVIIEHRSKP